MLTYLKLALLSQRKRQQLGRDKFLILAARAACRAGWLEVAERCREVVLHDTPAHLLRKTDDIPSFLTNEEFEPFLRTLEKFCNFEQAEFLLDELGIGPGAPPDVSETSIGDFAMELLRGEDWNNIRKTKG